MQIADVHVYGSCIFDTMRTLPSYLAASAVIPRKSALALLVDRLQVIVSVNIAFTPFYLDKISVINPALPVYTQNK